MDLSEPLLDPGAQRLRVQAAGEASTDRIEWIGLSLVFLPLAKPISDAKVLTGRQKPLTEIAFLFAEIETQEGHSGVGFSYSKRAGASVGRSGLATQAVAAFDIALEDYRRVKAVHELVAGRTHLMVDANQQWDRVTAMRFGRLVEPLNLTWIEEPLDAYDAEGHAALAAALDTPIATGEMLTSVAEHWELIRQRSVDFIQPDAPRVGGITQMLKIMALADHARMRMAPHFAMEVHLHLSAVYAHEPWVEHFEWLEPLFNERLVIRQGRMQVPNRAGLGFSMSEQARRWTALSVEVGQRA